jgi:uncharacterized protein YqgC (DUF456 family)
MPIKPTIRKITGWLLIVIGFIALLTPFTPGSWLIFVGAEILGLRFLIWDRIKKFLTK